MKKQTRHRKSSANRKEEMIRVLATKRDRKTLQAAADKLGLPLSTWIRLVVMEAARKLGEPDVQERTPGSTTGGSTV